MVYPTLLTCRLNLLEESGLTLDPLFLLNFQDILASGKRHSGVSEEFMDSLKRLDRSQLSSDENCAICTSHFLSDEYPLVVELNCKHKFDLECIKPWLSTNSTCPLCRSDVQQPKKTIELEDSEEEYDEMYG